MKSKAVHTILFFITAVSIFIGIFIVLNQDILSEKHILAETYLNESVQGLEIGAPVKYRGVEIGLVKEITFVYQEYKEVNHNNLILIRFGLKPDIFEKIQQQVEKGLRLRLVIQGITGIGYLEADYPKEYQEKINLTWQPKYPYIPSETSLIKHFNTSAESMLVQLQEINLHQTLDNLNQTTEKLNIIIENIALVEISQQTKQLLQELTLTAQNINNFIENNQQDAEKTIQIAQKNVTTLQKLLKKIDYIVNMQEENIEASIENTYIISHNLKIISEIAKDYPAQLFFSQPPKKPQVNK